MRNGITKYSSHLLTAIILLLCSQAAFAQKTITGKVTDAKGSGAAGVTVAVKGTQTATQTNTEGNYSITVPDGNSTLVFSSVSFATQELSVNGKASLNLVLSPTNTQLNEVVVVGYGTQVRKYMTGSVSKIDAKVLTNTPLPSFDAALQGRAPGLQVLRQF